MTADVDVILSEWAEDCKINKADLEESMLNTPQLQNKYLAVRVAVAREYSRAKKNLDRITHLRKLWYLGELNIPEELEKLQWEPLVENRKTRTIVDEFVENDPIIIKISLKVNDLKIKLETLDSILWELSRRTSNARGIVELRKFNAGQDY